MDERPRIEYIKELRNRVIIILVPTLIIFIILFLNYPTILNYLSSYYSLDIINLSPTESISTGINFSLAGAMLFFIPALVMQFLAFTRELIPKKQLKLIKFFGFIGFWFALSGFYFGVTYLSKMIFDNLLSYGIGQSLWSISTVLQTAVMFGFVVALAIQSIWILPTLAKTELYDKKTLQRIRPFVIIGLLIASAVLTPPDIMSLLIMMIPLYGSYEIGTLLTKSTKEVKEC